MSDQQVPDGDAGVQEASPFDELMGGREAAATTSFTTGFRGYDKDEVDAALARLTARLRADSAEISFLEERYRRVNETAEAQSRAAVERLKVDVEAKLEAAEAQRREVVDRLKAQLAAANARATKAEQQVKSDTAAAEERSREAVARLEAELVAANARASKAEQRAS